MSAEPDMMQRPVLPQVTLVAVTSVALEATMAALQRSQREVKFAKTLLLSHVAPDGLANSDIEWRAIDPLKSRADYSRFVLNDLVGHIGTSHALLVQWDGFVRNGAGWDEHFLHFDYIGAPWPQHRDGMAVGNGGFSLRSKRLLQATATLPDEGAPEDVAICRTYRNLLENYFQVRFADVDLARKFSYERSQCCGSEFGFHGAFNMLNEIHGDTLVELLLRMEPGVLGERECTELLVRAITERRWALSRAVWNHHRAHPHQFGRLLRGLGWLLRGHDGWPAPRIAASGLGT